MALSFYCLIIYQTIDFAIKAVINIRTVKKILTMIFEGKQTCLQSSQSLEYKDEKSFCVCVIQSELPAPKTGIVSLRLNILLKHSFSKNIRFLKMHRLICDLLSWNFLIILTWFC